LKGETATALGFANDTLVAGTHSGSILLWDQNKHKLIRSFSGVIHFHFVPKYDKQIKCGFTHYRLRIRSQSVRFKATVP